MDLTGWLKELGKPQTLLVLVVLWIALEVYQAVKDHDVQINRLNLEVHNKSHELNTRLSALEGMVEQVRATQRDFMNIWFSSLPKPIKPPGIQHPDIDHAE